MFFPGETIALQFNMPFVQGNVDKVYVSFKQDNKVIFIKTVNQGQVENTETGSQFTIVLSQQESLLFSNDKSFKVQLNVVLTSGSRATSKEMSGATLHQHIQEVVN